METKEMTSYIGSWMLSLFTDRLKLMPDDAFGVSTRVVVPVVGDMDISRLNVTDNQSRVTIH